MKMNETEPYVGFSNLQQCIPQWLLSYIESVLKIYNDTVEYLLFAVFGISNFLFLYFIIGAITYAYLPKPSKTKPAHSRKRVLFVIAHPDDECMFFGPTITRLKDCCDIYLLCLSVGNHYNRGSVRKRELYNSCTLLGISQSNIMVMNNSKMPDDPECIWNTKKTAGILLDHIESLSIHEVYTFDIGGVSGHYNHVSIFYAFARLCLNGDLPCTCRVFLLDSLNILRKYSLFLDAALSTSPFTKHSFIVTLKDSSVIREAMKQHSSQMVWYRAIYIYLSRYMYINTYKELEVEDVQLVMQMSDYNPLL